MNRNTAAGVRAACGQVLGVLENWEDTDIAKLDVEELLARFQNLRKQRYTPQVLETYKRRFRKAVSSYLEYLDDPGSWRPTSQERSVTPDRGRRTGTAAASTSVAGAVAPTGAGEVEYPFPLRPGVMARLVLPTDLTSEEVIRIQNFVAMLVVGTRKAEEP